MANRKNANGSTEKKSRKPKRKGHGPRENQTTADDLCLLDSEEYRLIEDRLVQTNPTLFCSVTIEYKGYRFVIIERPTEKNFAEFVEIINKRGIKYIARCSEAEISAERFEQIGVRIIELEFKDGSFPETATIQKWLQEVDCISKNFPGSIIATHCFGSFGRAPAIVAIALIDAGMSWLDAATLIREVRPGALNLKQLDGLEHYKPLKYLRKRSRCKCDIL